MVVQQSIPWVTAHGKCFTRLPVAIWHANRTLVCHEKLTMLAPEVNIYWIQFGLNEKKFNLLAKLHYMTVSRSLIVHFWIIIFILFTKFLSINEICLFFHIIYIYVLYILYIYIYILYIYIVLYIYIYIYIIIYIYI